MARILKYREKKTDDILLNWERPTTLTLSSSRCLYLMRVFRGRKILYIGKAGKQSVNARFKCQSKDRWVGKGIEADTELAPFVAGLFTSRRVTPKLIADVERLLIFFIQPPLNKPGRCSLSLHHREVNIRCQGQWPHPMTEFSYCRDLPRLLAISSR